jgi:hypothetical protein
MFDDRPLGNGPQCVGGNDNAPADFAAEALIKPGKNLLSR